MSPIQTIGSAYGAPALSPLSLPPSLPTDGSVTTAAPTQGFGQMLDGLVSSVVSKDAAADQITQKVLLGDSGQLHQSVIAMQEASVAFSLMVQVRNKLVDSYQELMRMNV